MLDELKFSPFFIFIKEGFKISDSEILLRLKLEDYELVTSEEERNKKILLKRYLYLTEDLSWSYLIDGPLGGVSHNKEIRNQIKELSKNFDVFTCGVQDYGFDFAYFKEGEIIRQYEFDIEKKEEKRVIIDIGVPFLIEDDAMSKNDDYDKVMTIAESFGIKLKFEKEQVRVYGRFENEMEKNMIVEGEY